jgi:hypothetical protein
LGDILYFYALWTFCLARANVGTDANSGQLFLGTAADRIKDQTYFTSDLLESLYTPL